MVLRALDFLEKGSRLNTSSGPSNPGAKPKPEEVKIESCHRSILSPYYEPACDFCKGSRSNHVYRQSVRFDLEASRFGNIPKLAQSSQSQACAPPANS